MPYKNIELQKNNWRRWYEKKKKEQERRRNEHKKLQSAWDIVVCDKKLADWILKNPDLIKNVRKRIFLSPSEESIYYLERLLKQVKVNMNTGCWEWQGELNSTGYGRISVRGRKILTHRLSYRLLKGNIPNGLVLLHSCDNPKCINIDHLCIGTQLENMLDCKRKGHFHVPKTSCPGEKNKNAKLTQLDVQEIRRLLSLGYKQNIIAQMFGIGQQNVSCIKHGKSWMSK